MVDLCALLSTFVITVVIGGPIAARLARIQVFRQPTLADPRSPKPTQRDAYFEPLDFGPDLVQWPSEVERPVTARPLPPWPSSTWDDPHFGKGAPREASTPGRVERRATPAPPPIRKPTPAQAPPPVQARPQEPEPAKPRPKKRREQPRSQPASPPQAAPAQDAAEVAEAVERLVAERGLAGAVQFLMQKNDWDFRTAAAFLANHRKR